MARLTIGSHDGYVAPSRQFLTNIEIAYWVYWIYLILGPALGFYLGNNTSAAFLLILTLLTVLRVHPVIVLKSKIVVFSIIIFLATYFSVFYNNEPFSTSVQFILRTILQWICNIIIIQELSKTKGFQKRAMVIMFFCGLLLFQSNGYLDTNNRLKISAGVVIENSNSFAAWMGYCVVGFLIIGIDNQNLVTKILYLVGALVATLVMGLTVSRSAMISVLFAIGVYVLIRFFHSQNPHIILNTILIVFLGYFVIQSSLFDPMLKRYQERGTEDTGRLMIWSGALKVIPENPLGIGSRAYSPGILVDGKYRTAHNAFLFLCLLGGILPSVILLIMYIYGLVKINSFTTNNYISFLLPLYIYSFLQINTSNMFFTSLWAIIPLVYTFRIESLPDIVRNSPDNNLMAKQEWPA